MADEYTCAQCKGVFIKGWSDEEAEAEYEENFGADMDRAIVCDDCFNMMTAEYSIEQYRKRQRLMTETTNPQRPGIRCASCWLTYADTPDHICPHCDATNDGDDPVQRPAEGWRLVPADLLERLLGGDPTVYPLLAPYAAAPVPPPADEGMVEAARAAVRFLRDEAYTVAANNDQRREISRASAKVYAALALYLPPAPLWRCFHCDESFTDEASAREHFGAYVDCEPICKVGAERYRDLEDQLAVYRSESDETSKTFYRLGADHARALTREEEKGYERGLRDARHEEIWRAFLTPPAPLSPAGQDEPAGWQPIASAPLDGTRVLLWSDVLDPHTIQGQWRDYCWVDVWNNDPIELGSGAFVEFTHWQPLPSPPSEPGQ